MLKLMSIYLSLFMTMKTIFTLLLSVAFFVACQSADAPTPASVEELDTELVDEDAETESLGDPSEASARATPRTRAYIMNRTDENKLTPDFEIYDYFVGATEPDIIDFWPRQVTSPIRPKIILTKGKQLVKSYTLANGWHVLQGGCVDTQKANLNCFRGNPEKVFIQAGIIKTIALGDGGSGVWENDEGRLLRVKIPAGVAVTQPANPEYANLSIQVIQATPGMSFEQYAASKFYDTSQMQNTVDYDGQDEILIRWTNQKSTAARLPGACTAGKRYVFTRGIDGKVYGKLVDFTGKKSISTSLKYVGKLNVN